LHVKHLSDRSVDFRGWWPSQAVSVTLSFVIT
jgi:hypothetical protein